MYQFCMRANCGHAWSTHDARGCSWRGCKCKKLTIALTRREIEMMRALASGMGTKQAAVKLGCAEKTAAFYRHSLMVKLESGSFPELLGVALRNGIISLEDLPLRPAREYAIPAAHGEIRAMQ